MNRILSLIAVSVACMVASLAPAEVHSIRERGKTLIEAEDCASSDQEFPYTEPCKKCSSQHNLGYYWKDSWFEIEVSVPRSGEYGVSLRASSAQGTNINVLSIEPKSPNPLRLGAVKVPKTGGWAEYTITNEARISLAAGNHTLRFKNLVDGANVDYITFSAISNTPVASFHPPKNAGPDKNPLKGFGSGWWRDNDDYATVGFQYIEWGQLEPRDDQFDWQYVEELLNREGTRGRHLILQFVVDWDHKEPVDQNYVGPDWLLKKVGEHRGYSTPGDPTSRPMRATKYDNPEFVSEATEAIEALTNHFKDDPRVYVLQAGLLGFWSEWHTFPREDWSPSQRTKSTILSTYLDNLPRDCFTQIRYPDEPSVEPRHGIGYTNGSATPTKHGYEFGKEIESRALWKNGPVSGEWPPNVETKYWQRFFATDEGARFIKQARYSTLLMPEPKEIKEKLPDWSPDGAFMKMHRQMGYNLQADRVRHVVTDEGRVHIELKLDNVGIAPFYRDWDVQVAVLENDSAKVIDLIDIDTDLRTLGPGGSVELKGVSTTTISPRRSFRIGVRVLQPGADEIKKARWPLQARNAYVVLANDIQVIDGAWDGNHSLRGGWNIVHAVDEDLFPFAGSVRPAGRVRQPLATLPESSDGSQWTYLLDEELSQWEIFMGVPHTSVDVDWPSKSESGIEGKPMGLNNDPLSVFSVKPVDGDPVLRVSGEIYGGLTTRKEYENYHLSLQFKWGEKKWPPRVNAKRDSGLLVHCVGQHGAFWNVWKRSLECQIQEGDCGDFIALAGSGCNVRVRRIENSDRPQFDPAQPLYHGTGYVLHGPSEEEPNGQWNTVEVYSIGQTTVFVVNGKPNMVLERTVEKTQKGWLPLTKGQLQIQSEAAEIYYRDIKIRAIKAFPESLESIPQPFEGNVEWFQSGAGS